MKQNTKKLWNFFWIICLILFSFYIFKYSITVALYYSLYGGLIATLIYFSYVKVLGFSKEKSKTKNFFLLTTLYIWIFYNLTIFVFGTVYFELSLYRQGNMLLTSGIGAIVPTFIYFMIKRICLWRKEKKW